MTGVSPGSLIPFVSKGFRGRSSDNNIFVHTKLVEQLEPTRDAVMTDKGFLIDDILAQHFVKLIQPPFSRNKKQLSAEKPKLTWT